MQGAHINQRRRNGRLAAPGSKPSLHDRPPLSSNQTEELTGLFKLLANDTRLQLLHALARERELCVSDLCDRLDMKPQAVSNQLQLLAERGVVVSRRAGIQIYYRIEDPCVPALIERGLCLLEDVKAKRP